MRRGGLACLFAALEARALPLPSLGGCKNHYGDATCEEWARGGECDRNKGFMRQQCARACNSCGWVDNACEGTAPPAKMAGGINEVFERAAEMPSATVHHRDPWVVTFSNFVSDDEAAAFIDTTSHHFERSLSGDQVSPVRTSQQAWCQPHITDACVKDPLVRAVHERVVNVTGVPIENAEFFQVLRYEPGQFYKTHHDQNSGPESLIGVRLFTFFIYLHSPEGGGGTRFPQLNITIEPVKGSALLWPNVFDYDLSRTDSRTSHEALPPTGGLKYSANLWLHQYDFRTPNTHGCDVRKRITRPIPASGVLPESVAHAGRSLLQDNELAPDDEEQNDEL